MKTEKNFPFFISHLPFSIRVSGSMENGKWKLANGK